MSKPLSVKETRGSTRSATSSTGVGSRRRLSSKIHTFESLSEPRFRWFWLGMLFSFAGMQMQLLARGWLVIDNLNGSALDLGLVYSSHGVPILLFSLFGGVVSDRVDKRKLLAITQGSIGLISLGMAILILTDRVQMWHVYVAAFLIGTIFTFNMPSRQSLVSELVSPEHLSNAIALNAAGMNMNRVAAPALGGILVGVLGVEGVYFIIVGCYAFVVLSLVLVPAEKRQRDSEGKSLFGDLKEGLSYVRHSPEVSGLLTLAIVPVVFAMSYQSLLPVFAKKVLDVDSSGLGFLMGAIGVGALVGTLGIASFGNFQRRGLLMLVLLLIFGTALNLFALSTTLYLSLAALTVVGMGSQGYMALNNTLIMTNTEPRMRGRVMSIYMMSWGMMPLGVLPAAAIADALGAPEAVSMAGGMLILSTLAVALFRPQVRRLA